jgi:hypothetical protein
MHKRWAHGALEPCQTLFHAAGKVHPQDAFVALIQGFKVARRENCLQMAKRVPCTRHRSIAIRLRGQDDKKTLRRTTIMHLPEVMKIAGPKLRWTSTPQLGIRRYLQ